MKKNLKLSAAVIATIFGIISCSEHAQFSRLGRNGINTPDNSKTTGGVTTDFYTQDGGGSTQVDPQVDLLFIVDASVSMQDNIDAVKSALDGLVNNLISNQVDLCVGVMLADPGQTASTGNLRTSNGNKSVYCTGTDGATTLVTKIQENLTFPLSGSDYEGGLMAYRNLIIHKQQEALNAGFLREFATLAVIFVSDEDDICDLGSSETSLRTTYCQDAYDSQITPLDIFASVSAFQGLNGVFSAGVIYTAADGAGDSTGDGYIEFLNQSKGKTVSLSLVGNQTAFNAEFSALSNPIIQAAQLETTFDLSKEACPATIAVTVDGNAVTNFTISSNNQRIRIAAADAGNEGSVINISYTAKPLEGC